MKKTIRLSEADLHKVITECVQTALNEIIVGGVSLHGSYPGEENGDFKSARDFNTLSMLSQQTKSHANEPASRQANDSMNRHLKNMGLDDKSIINGTTELSPAQWAKRDNEYNQAYNASVDQYNKIADRYGLSKPYPQKRS